MRIRIIVASVMAVLLLTGSTFSQEMMGRMGLGRWDQMDLTEEQLEKIKDIKTSLMKEVTPLCTKLKTLRAELDELLIAEKPDMGAVNKKIDTIGSLRTQIQKKRIAQHLKVRELLTEEQRVWFDAKGRFGRGLGGRMMGHGMHPMGDRSRGRGMMRERRVIKILEDGEEEIIEEEIE